MKVFRAILLLLAINCVNLSQAQSHQYDWDSKFEKIESYVKKIDTVDVTQYPAIINEIGKDSDSFSYYGVNYSTFEYITIQFFLSGNVITCKRMAFLEEVARINTSFNQKIVEGLRLYANRNLNDLRKLNMETHNDSLNKSFLPSLIMSLEVADKNYSDNYDVFTIQVDSIYQKYCQLDGKEIHLKLLLPLCDIFMIWHDKFPNIEISEFYRFIEERKWERLDANSLYRFTENIFYYEPACQSIFNIHATKMLGSAVSVFPDRHFHTDDFLIKKTVPITPKKKRCKKCKHE